MEFEGYRWPKSQTPVFLEIWADSVLDALRVDLVKLCMFFELAIGRRGNSGWIIILPGTFHYRQQPKPLKDSPCTLNVCSKHEPGIEL